MTITSILAFFLFMVFLITAYAETIEIPNWIKDNAKQMNIQNNSQDNLMFTLENLSKQGMIKNIIIHTGQPIYSIPYGGKTIFVNISGWINEYGKSGFVSLTILKPDNSKEILHTPILETGKYSTYLPIDDEFQKGTYQIFAKFNGKNLPITYFHLIDNNTNLVKIPSWLITTFHWWVDKKISDTEFIHSVQYLTDHSILSIPYDASSFMKLEISVDGQHLVRRGTTHTIVTHIISNNNPVEGARVTITIEDYDENIIRELNGFSNQNGDFIFSWEIPKKFDGIKTLLAYISVTYGDSSQTKLFKFQVYCLPGESGCKTDGN